MVFAIKLIMVAAVPPLSRTVGQVTEHVNLTGLSKVKRESKIKRKQRLLLCCSSTQLQQKLNGLSDFQTRLYRSAAKAIVQT